MKLVTMRGGFAEIYQDGLRFSLLKRVGEEEYRSYHGSTCCKDFFTDVFWSERMGEQTNIHGFHWSPGTISLDEPYYFMAMEHSTDLSSKAVGLEWFLNRFCMAFGFSPCHVKAVPENPNAVVVAFSNEWTQRPVLVSLVTGLMRVGLMVQSNEPVHMTFARLLKQGNPYGEYDRSEFGKDGVVPLLMDCLTDCRPPHPGQTFEQYKNPYQCHHSGGFIAYTTGRATG